MLSFVAGTNEECSVGRASVQDEQDGNEKRGDANPSGVTTGAAVLGGVAGLAVFGVVGAVAGAGALAYASTRDGKVGEVAKKGGEVYSIRLSYPAVFPLLRYCVSMSITTALIATRAGSHGQTVVSVAKKAKEIDAQHVGIASAYQSSPELGIS